MKRVVCILLSITLLTVFSVGCTEKPAPAPATSETKAPVSKEEGKTAEGEKITFIVSHAATADNHYQHGLYAMRDYMEEKTNGQMTLEIHTDGVLGDEAEAIELLQSGTIDMSVFSPSVMTAHVNEYMVCDLPFTFATPEEAYEFYDGPVGEELLKLAEEVGLIGLSWWENGFRNFTSSIKPIETPEDLAGLKIRTMLTPVHMSSVEALGANPTPIPWGELYSALQQGVVDGQENPISLIWEARLYETQDYVTISRHFYDPSPLMVSKITWGKLTEEQQSIIKEGAKIGRDVCRRVSMEKDNEFIEYLKDEGITITTLTEDQVKAFQEATKDVYKEFEDTIGKDFMKRFLEATRR